MIEKECSLTRYSDSAHGQESGPNLCCSNILVYTVLFVLYKKINLLHFEGIQVKIRQAGAELSQAQPKLGLWILLR